MQSIHTKGNIEIQRKFKNNNNNNNVNDNNFYKVGGYIIKGRKKVERPLLLGIQDLSHSNVVFSVSCNSC